MRVLIVATNATPPGLSNEVRIGRHQRVDYLELAQRFRTGTTTITRCRHAACAAGSRTCVVLTFVRRWRWRIWRNVADMMQ
jgi:hypothetical protein